MLLGFSYGGMVVTGALEHIADRVRELVYLDAFVPNDGQAVADIAGFDRTRTPRASGTNPTVPPRERTFDDPAEADFTAPRRTPQPIRTFTEPVRLAQPLESFDVRTHVRQGARRTLARPAGPTRSGMPPTATATTRRGGTTRSTSNHMIPQNQPAELADILLSLA